MFVVRRIAVSVIALLVGLSAMSVPAAAAAGAQAPVVTCDNDWHMPCA
jgi:hypothetical protein